MITRFLAVVLVLVVAALGAARLDAHDEFRFVGVVAAMDTARSVVSVKFKEADGKEETVRIALRPTTVITRDSKPVAKSEMKAGVHIVVDALGDDYDSLEATDIRIVPPPAMPAK